MKLKIKVSSILLFIFGLAIIFSVQFFYLGIGISAAYLAIISVIGLLVCIAFCNGTLKQMYKRLNFAFLIGIVVPVCYAIIFLYTAIAFPEQGFNSTVLMSYQYVAVLLVYPLGCYLLMTDNVKKIFDIMNVVAGIWYFLVLAQKILYETSGYVILTGLVQGSSLATRNSNLRISLMLFGNIMIIYNFYQLYSKHNKQKILNLVLLVVGLYELIVVQQTRAYSIVVFVALFMIVLLDKNTKKGFSRKLLMFGIIVLILLQTNAVSNMFESFSLSGEYSYSTEARLYAWNYYWTYFLEHPIFGMGFVSDVEYYSVVHGSLGIAYHSDVGFVGQLSRWGIFIIPVYVIPIARQCFITFKMWKRKEEDFILYIAIMLYILGTSITLIMLARNLIILYPVSIILFEYKYYKLRTDNRMQTIDNTNCYEKNNFIEHNNE